MLAVACMSPTVVWSSSSPTAAPARNSSACSIVSLAEVTSSEDEDSEIEIEATASRGGADMSHYLLKLKGASSIYIR